MVDVPSHGTGGADRVLEKVSTYPSWTLHSGKARTIDGIGPATSAKRCLRFDVADETAVSTERSMAWRRIHMQLAARSWLSHQLAKYGIQGSNLTMVGAMMGLGFLMHNFASIRTPGPPTRDDDGRET